jgi:alpha-beta hydrolase superfamily lysophospholipase
MSAKDRPSGTIRRRALAGGAIFFFVVGAAIYLVDSDLVNFFLPARYVVLTFMSVAAVLAGVHLARVREPGGSRSRYVTGLLIASLALAAFVFVREFNAYREIDLSFENEGVTLAGTLYLPKSTGQYAAVVIAHGSIKAPRRLYHLWADNLVRRGIAVFSFDKRGTGKSGGVHEDDNNASVENLTLLASDVAKAIEAVRQHSEISDWNVGILGLSMGGWLAPIATQMVDSVAFMALVSGPSVSVGEENYFSDLTGEIHDEGSGLSVATIDSLVLARAPSGFDPRDLLRQSSVPGLWLFGAADTSVPTVKSTVVLDRLAREYDRRFEYIVYPDAEHLGFVMRWPFDLAPGLIEDLTRWINRQTQS